jgi:hypothetical protein
MIHQSTRRRVWEKLLESLGSAEAGGRELDIVIHYLLGTQAKDAAGEAGQMIELLVEEGYPWEVVSELLDASLPPYTTALDATLPGENIMLALYSPRRERWAAVHKTPSGQQVLVWAASECLARRRAALKALGAALLARGAAAPAKPAVPPAPQLTPRPASGPTPRPVPSVQGWSRIPESETEEADAPDDGETEWKILF